MNILLWIGNGFLVLVYLAVDHWLSLALLASLAWLLSSTPTEQRNWALGASLLAMAANAFAPAPVPLFLLIVASSGLAALHLEHFNSLAQRWNVVRGLGLYALAGIGFAIYRRVEGGMVSSDPMMAQGAVYLNALIGISMYVIPLGFLAYLAQSLWAHPPTPGTPEELIARVRTRGRD